MKKKMYLDGTPLEEALSLWSGRLRSEGIDKTLLPERVKVSESLGRITAEAVSAKISSPFYHSAAMDGYAVKFVDTVGASETKPVRLRTGEQAIYVDTGDPMPDGFDAVIMIEDVNIVSSNESQATSKDKESRLDYIEIIEPATPWQHVRVIGEDIVATELIVPENHSIRPVDIGALLAGGHTDIMVRKRPMVAVIPTGSELREAGSSLKKGDIIEYNSHILAGLVAGWGGEVLRFGIVRDDLDELKQNISDACDIADMIVVNAGSSAGSEDFTVQAIRELGDLILHGIGIKPGKPVALGIVKGKPVFGIPGYPVSAYITSNIFVKSLIHVMLGIRQPEPERIRALLSRQVASALGVEEFVRVKVGIVGGKTVATPLSRGAGVIMSLVRADGILKIPPMSEGIGSGSEIEVELTRPRKEIKNTIVCIGSHDNTLDLLSNFLKKRHPEFSLSSAHVGSMGGLIALKRGDAHMASTHLLDEVTGEYNAPFISKLLPDKKVALVNLVYREQGLLVKKGNPKNIRDFKDLTRDDVVFINRQSGSGTRLLTDKNLRELNIAPSDVRGYDKEEYTHMGVASAVLTGMADTGLAVLAAANALGLDFIPVAKERYDIAIPFEFVGSEMMEALLKIVREDNEFRSAVINLGGYDISDMGRIVFES